MVIQIMKGTSYPWYAGYSYEELSEVSPDHRYIAYTMYDKDKDSFTLLVRDLVTGTLCDKPRADRVSNISWAMDGKALVYVVTNEDRRPYRYVDLLLLHQFFYDVLYCTAT
jgi:protease II